MIFRCLDCDAPLTQHGQSKSDLDTICENCGTPGRRVSRGPSMDLLLQEVTEGRDLRREREYRQSKWRETTPFHDQTS